MKGQFELLNLHNAEKRKGCISVNIIFLLFYCNALIIYKNKSRVAVVLWLPSVY